jgi:hypothetical protein
MRRREHLHVFMSTLVDPKYSHNLEDRLECTCLQLFLQDVPWARVAAVVNPTGSGRGGSSLSLGNGAEGSSDGTDSEDGANGNAHPALAGGKDGRRSKKDEGKVKKASDSNLTAAQSSLVGSCSSLPVHTTSSTAVTLSDAAATATAAKTAKVATKVAKKVATKASPKAKKKASRWGMVRSKVTGTKANSPKGEETKETKEAVGKGDEDDSTAEEVDHSSGLQRTCRSCCEYRQALRHFYHEMRLHSSWDEDVWGRKKLAKGGGSAGDRGNGEAAEEAVQQTEKEKWLEKLEALRAAGKRLHTVLHTAHSCTVHSYTHTPYSHTYSYTPHSHAGKCGSYFRMLGVGVQIEAVVIKMTMDEVSSLWIVHSSNKWRWVEQHTQPNAITPFLHLLLLLSIYCYTICCCSPIIPSFHFQTRLRRSASRYSRMRLVTLWTVRKPRARTRQARTITWKATAPLRNRNAAARK